MNIPRKPEEVDAAWLSGALASRFPGVVVAKVAVEEIIHGAATRLKIRLGYATYGTAQGLPHVIWVKSGWEPHSEWLTSTSAIDAQGSLLSRFRRRHRIQLTALLPRRF